MKKISGALNIYIFFYNYKFYISLLYVPYIFKKSVICGQNHDIHNHLNYKKIKEYLEFNFMKKTSIVIY